MPHQTGNTFASDLVEKRLEAIPELVQIIINNAMPTERVKYLQAEESDGTFASEIRYSAFGEIRYTGGATVTVKRYTGQQQVAEWCPYLLHSYISALIIARGIDRLSENPGVLQPFRGIIILF